MKFVIGSSVPEAPEWHYLHNDDGILVGIQNGELQIFICDDVPDRVEIILGSDFGTSRICIDGPALERIAKIRRALSAQPLSAEGD